jgi:hypothetical protein
MRAFGLRTVSVRVCAALLSGWAGAAAADDGINTTISGYGTLGGTFTSDTQFAYHHDGTEFTGAAEQFDIGIESRLGVQALVDFGSGFSVTAQELIRQRGSSEWSLGTEWAYLQYATDSNLKFRLGRVVVGTFLLSESRNVGYAAPWFRAPNELYGSGPIQSLNGGQVIWNRNLGPVELGLQGAFGNTKLSYMSAGSVADVTVKNMYNLSVSLQYRDLLFRAAQTKISVPTSIPLGPTFAVAFELNDTFNTLGLQYDNGKAIVLAEWAKRTDTKAPILDIPVAASSEWYAAGGWRFGKLTPLLIYGKFEPSTSLVQPAGNFGTWSASLRYDVVRNIALKAQVSRAQAGNETYWVTPDTTSSKRVNVFSLGADFVF